MLNKALFMRSTCYTTVMRGFLSYPARFVDRLLDRVMAIVGAIGFSQAPGFIDNYLQRLGGHVAEAQRNVATWQTIADKSAHGDLHALIALYRVSDKTEVLEAGRKCTADVLRLEDLVSALDAIVAAPPWSRAVAFLRHLDADIARATAAQFVPTIPLNVEGLCYAIAGLMLALCVYAGLKRAGRLALRALRGAWRRRKQTAAGGGVSRITLGTEEDDDDPNR
jgi:hypothetical protein